MYIDLNIHFNNCVDDNLHHFDDNDDIVNLNIHFNNSVYDNLRHFDNDDVVDLNIHFNNNVQDLHLFDSNDDIVDLSVHFNNNVYENLHHFDNDNNINLNIHYNNNVYDNLSHFDNDDIVDFSVHFNNNVYDNLRHFDNDDIVDLNIHYNNNVYDNLRHFDNDDIVDLSVHFNNNVYDNLRHFDNDDIVDLNVHFNNNVYENLHHFDNDDFVHLIIHFNNNVQDLHLFDNDDVVDLNIHFNNNVYDNLHHFDDNDDIVDFSVHFNNNVYDNLHHFDNDDIVDLNIRSHSNSTSARTVTLTSTSSTASSTAGGTIDERREQQKQDAAAVAEDISKGTNEKVQNVLAELLPSNSTEAKLIVIPTEMGTLSVAAFSPEAVQASGGSAWVCADGADCSAKVQVTAELLSFVAEAAGAKGDAVLLSVLAMEEDVAAKFRDPPKPPEPAESGVVSTLISQPLVIDFRGEDGEVLKLGVLPEPLQLQLQVDPAIVQNTTLEPTCASWNKDTSSWSTEGVHTLAVDLERGSCHCETDHLSIFGLVLQEFFEPVRCRSTLGLLLNAKAFEIMSRTEWLQHPSAILLMCLYALCLVVLAVAYYYDCKASQRQKVDLIMRLRKTTEKQVQDPKENESGCCLWLHQLLGCDGTWTSSQSKPPIRDRASKAVQGFLASTAKDCILSMHAQRTGVHPKSIELILEADNTSQETSTPHPSRRKRNSVTEKARDFMLGKDCASADIQATAEQFLDARPFTRCFWLLLAVHPLLALARLCAVTTYTRRASLLIMKLLSAGLVSAIFFSTNGAPVEEGCEATSSLAAELVDRFFTSFWTQLFGQAIVFVLALLQSRSVAALATKEEIWLKWTIKLAIYWVCAWLYKGFCALYISLFLANVSHHDRSKWLQHYVLSLFQAATFFPFLQAVGLGIVVSLAMRCYPSSIKKTCYLELLMKTEVLDPSSALKDVEAAGAAADKGPPIDAGDAECQSQSSPQTSSVHPPETGTTLERHPEVSTKVEAQAGDPHGPALDEETPSLVSTSQSSPQSSSVHPPETGSTVDAANAECQSQLPWETIRSI